MCERSQMSPRIADELRAMHRGPVIDADDPRLDDARRTFNALIDARPAVIARPVDESDLASAIAVATQGGLPVSVRGGGHSVAGHSVGEGSLMIDLRLLREVRVDADARRAWVGGGNDVDAPTQAEGSLP